jgi:acylphosphatase
VATARFAVSGRVQGVGFRWFVVQRARELALAGWVRNAADGSVEACASGPAAALDALEAALRRGPAGARVESVSRGEPQGVDTLPDPFSILR